MAVRHSAGGNLFDCIPETLSAEFFETLLERPGCRLERIVSRGHATPAGQWYDQEWDEWVLVIKGKAALEIEGRTELKELHPGDHLLITAHQRHRVAWTDANDETIWLALHLDTS